MALSKKRNKERVRLYREEGKGVLVTKEEAIKLACICQHLDREIQGLGKRESMLDLVRYGGILMREVKRQLAD